jgi:hypothetical protein
MLSTESTGLADPLALHPSPATDPVTEELSESGLDVDIDVDTSPGNTEPLPKRPAPKPETKKSADNSFNLDDFDPPHKQVDFNEVCILIMGYLKKRGRTDSDQNCGSSQNRCTHYDRFQTVNDIIALLHAEL